MSSIEQLKPLPGEGLYVDYDEDTGDHCVFGEDSGFAYSSWSTPEEAEDDLVRREGR